MIITSLFYFDNISGYVSSYFVEVQKFSRNFGNSLKQNDRKL